MKTLPLIFIAMLCVGCANTTVYEDGKIAARIQSNAENVTVKTYKGTYFHADKLNNSEPTEAQGRAAKGKLDSWFAGLIGILAGWQF